MSFGFSVGDILAVLKLTGKIRKDFKGAPRQFNSISEDVRSLSIVIQDAHANIDQLTEHQAANFTQILATCKNLLNELENVMDKWCIISKPRKGKEIQRLWKRLRWEPEEIIDLRAQITSNIVLLNAYNDHATAHNVARLVRHSEGDQKQLMLDWISVIDYIPQQNHLVSRLQANSRRWLFNMAEYHDWQNQKGQTLFCPGDPGSGKTFTTALVVKVLQEQAQDNPGVLNTYVYCNYQAQDQDVQGLLRSLFRNSLQQAGSVPEAIRSQCDRKRIAEQGLLRDETIKLLKSLYGSFERVNLLVDALDELPTEVSRRFISDLLKLQQSCQFNLFLTSRQIPDIQHQCTGRGAKVIEIRASDEDIHQFLEDSMFKLPRFVGRDPALQNEIVEEITQASSGMFLLAELHLRSLMYKKSPKALRLSLEKLSAGSNAYDKAYEDSMARIVGLGPESETLANQALMILVCAREALRPHDLTYALSVEPDSEALDRDNIPDIEDVAGICAGLIVIDKESDIVRLVHKSAQEYFDRNQSRWFPNASETMARLCLKYKSLTTLIPGFNKDIETTWPPFWRYADINWAYHSRRADKDDEVSEVRNGNVDEDQRLSNLQSVSNIAISLLATDMFGSLTSALQNACRERRHALVELLISVNDYDLSQPTCNPAQPCQCTYDGSDSEVSSALEGDVCSRDGTEIETGDADGRKSPCSYCGLLRIAHRETLNSQSETKAAVPHRPLGSEEDTCSEDQTESDTHGSNDRQRPCWLGGLDHRDDETLTKIGHNHNHDPDALLRNLWSKDDSDMQPLLTWCRRYRYGREERNLLIEEDLTKEGCLLVISAANGDHAMVRILLNHGADPNVVGTLGQTPLYIAARYGKHTVVSLLLEQPTINPDCEYKGMTRCNTRPITRYMEQTQNVCWTPLLVAAYFGRKKCVRLLLDQAQRNYRDGSGRNAACLAAEAGRARVLEELLQWSDIQLDPGEGLEGLSPLDIALRNEREKTALTLIPYSDINCQYSTGDRPLNVAAKTSSLKAIEKLFAQKYIRVNAKGLRGRTVLHNAAMAGDERMMALILANPSIDINARDNDGNTAVMTLLHYLRRRHNEDSDGLALMLSRPELDINAQNLNGNTALLIAASFDFQRHFRPNKVLNALLFRPGVDREHRNNLGQTVLTRAVKQGSPMIQTIVRETQLSHQFRETDDEGETLVSLAAVCHGDHCGWSDSNWQFIVEMSPPEFMHRNTRSRTPEQIRQEWLSSDACNRNTPMWMHHQELL
ncbi:hypothetical protein NW766_007677 [Fusarium irregulare]|uniref:NACHT domain-containing protein n=1 Tax=Fusarium irregulare TaxID=2494466 RepID=A0A9W8PMN1_9HYPO|nr:hypothetical protein NW766_007677 [Fusarium irregulare]